MDENVFFSNGMPYICYNRLIDNEILNKICPLPHIAKIYNNGDINI